MSSPYKPPTVIAWRMIGLAMFWMGVFETAAAGKISPSADEPLTGATPPIQFEFTLI
jgi:hypothetical protein